MTSKQKTKAIGRLAFETDQSTLINRYKFFEALPSFLKDDV